MSNTGILADGPRIILRRFRRTDLHEFQAYRTDPEVGKYQSWAVSSDAEATRFLEDVAVEPLLERGEWCQLAIALSATEELIGDIGICLDADGAAAEAGITLSPAYQHGGLAKEAMDIAFGWIFGSSDAQRIYCIADKRNTPSIRLMDRLGMAFEEEYETEFKGEPCVELRYSRARARFTAAQEKR